MSDNSVSFPAASLPSSEALAYLGDAVFSLYVRDALVRAGISHAGELNRLSLAYVTAESQAALFERIKDRLTEWERDIFHRAYNHKGLKPPKHASYAQYRTATGIEAIVGALYYTKQENRIYELLGELSVSAEH